MHNSHSDDSSHPQIYPPSDDTGGISGRWVILGIFILAVGATAFEWNYTRMYRAPFIPLREAIAENFGRAAKVKIDGGRNKRGPMTLRIVIDVPFDPTAETERKQSSEALQRLEKLAVDHLDLKEYEFIQIYLVQIIPEGTPKRLEHRRSIADVISAKPIELPAANQNASGTTSPPQDDEIPDSKTQP